MFTNPFSELSASPAPVSAYRVSYDLAGLPVTVSLPFTPHALTDPSPAIPTNPYPSSSLGAVSALLIPSSPLIADSGCTGLLVQSSNFSALAPFFSCKPLPSVPFTLPDGSSLQVGGPSHLIDSLIFPHKQSPASCYFLPASDLFHSLFGVSPLIRPHGHAIFTNLSCSFFNSPDSTLPFLTGRKAAEADLWHLSVPPAPAAFSLAVAAPLHPPSAFFSLQSLTAARFVAYWHRALGSPSLSTFLRALKLGFIHGIPLLTPKLVSKYPPSSLSTSFEHLDTLRKGIASTRKKISSSCLGPVVSTSMIPRTSPRLEAIQSSFPVTSSRAS